MSDSDRSFAAYVRTSTLKQDDKQQRESITRWVDRHGGDPDAIDWYVDIGESGAKDDREQFQGLTESVEDGLYSHVVCWEMSRISRTGQTLQRFFDTCEENDTTIVITDGSIEKIKPDGTGRFVADIVGMVYQQERRTLIRRIESGIAQAQREGKWVGQVPAGFKRDDSGYLHPNLDPDHDSGEVGYLELRTALDQIEAGNESYRSAADGLPVTRQTLSRIHQTEDRLSWYLDAEANDEAVSQALTDLSLTQQ